MLNKYKYLKKSSSFNDFKLRKILGLSCSKKLSALSGGITSKHHGDFYCLNCIHFFETEKKLELHKKVYESKELYNVVIPFEENKTRELNKYQIPDKVRFLIYVDFECMIKKILQCKNNP